MTVLTAASTGWWIGLVLGIVGVVLGVIGAVVWSLLLANGFDVEEFLREIEQGR